MADYYDFTDDVILPDDFNAEELDGNVNTEEGVPTTEQPVGDETSIEQTQNAEDTSTQVSELEAELQATLPEETPAKPQTIKVKYNHEEREIGLDEAATLAQKGMNYDKLEEKLKAFESNNRKTNKLAKQLGYENAEEMIAKAEENFINRQVRELVDAGNTEAMAKFLVEQKMAKAAETAEKEEPKPQEEPTPEAPSKPLISSDRKAELDEFVRAFPGITKLPDEVLTANRNGVRLKAAYENYQLKQKYEEQQKQLSILKQNQAAANRAPVTGVNGKAAPKKEEPVDPFMEGFDAEY